MGTGFGAILGAVVMSIVVALSGLPVAFAADCGEPVPPPKYQVGEKWTWRDGKGNERMQEVVGFEGDLVQVKWVNPMSEPDKEGVFFYDVDRVIRKAIRPGGEVVTKQGVGAYTEVGEKTLDFPLQVGKTWERSVMRSSRAGDLRQYYFRYKIIACEEASTPAGKFPALKIEVEMGPTTGARPGFTGGTFYLWYAAQAKSSIRRQYVPSQWWRDARDEELIRFESK